MRNLLRISLVLSLFFVLCFVKGQKAELRILDDLSGEPIPYAHARITPTGSSQSRYYVSDGDGYTGFTVTVPSVVSISYVGYLPVKDTLMPGMDAVIRLKSSVTTFDEMVVTAQYSPVSSDRSLYKINVINALQIKKKAAYDLAGLLRNQLNVRLSQDGALGTGMSIQGLSGENVKILIDGVPVIGRLNGTIDLSQINLQQVQQVEVVEGPMSVIYGSNALAGVINIIPKGNDTRPLSANAGTYTESVGVYNFDGGFGLKKGIHGFSLQGGRNFFSGFAGIRSGRDLEWKPKRQYTLDADYNLNLSNIYLKTKLSLFDELLLGKGNLLPPYFEKAFDNHFNTERYTAKVSLETKGCNRFSANTSYSYYRRTRTLYYNDLTIPEKTFVESDTTFFGAFMSRGMYTYRGTSGKLGFQAGYDLNAEWASGDRISGQSRNITDLAAFISMQYHPVARLSVQPGLRMAYNSKFNSPLVYALHIKATPFAGTNIRASYSSGFRAPSIKELYMYFVDVNHNIIGNPELKAENSNHVQFQFLQKLERTKYAAEAEVDLFLNDISNIITLAIMPDGSYTYINVENYRTKGYNAQLRTTLFPSFDVRLGYGHTGKLKSNSGNGGEAAYLWSPEFTSEATWKIDKHNISFSAFYKYTGKMPQYYINDQGSISEGQVDDYNNLDLSIYKSFWSERITLTFGAKNLFDVRSITSTGSEGGIHTGGSNNVPVAWGRTVFAKINFSIWRDEKKEVAH